MLGVPNSDDWANNIEKRLAKLVRWKEEGDMPVMPHIKVVPPFKAQIMNESLPTNFKTPMIKKFDGVRDPHEHIMAYQAAIMIIEANDVVMCIVLFSTLEGMAQRWFIELSGKSIDTFYNLAVKFTTHFMRGRKTRKHFSYLTIVKHRLGEFLRDFLNRWRAEVDEIEGMDDKSAITMFIDALRARDLYKSLRRKAHVSYVAMMTKVDWYAEANEAN